MKTNLHILALEANAADAALNDQRLLAAFPDSEIVRAAEREACLEALAQGPYDVILADYSLPGFSGGEALALARARCPDTPFIFVSGALGEDAVMEALKGGATDYVRKDRLARLVPAVERAVRETAERAELRRSEEAMRQSEHKYRELFENLSDAAFLVDEATGRILDTNRRAETMLRCPRGQILGRKQPQFLALDRGVVRGGRPAAAGPPACLECELVRGDGTAVPVEVRATRLLLYGRPLLLHLCHDVTERRQFESRFLRTQRLETLGILAGGLAHDLNNIFAPALIGTQLLRQKVGDAEAVRWLDRLEQSVQRGAHLVSQVVAFARGTGGEPVDLQPQHFIHDTLEIIRGSVPPALAIESDVPSELWPVRGVPAQLRQLLMNLCLNARDAMAEGGTLRVAARNQRLNEAQARQLHGATPGPFVVLAVADTGPGLPENIRARLAESFFAAGALSPESDLGLATIVNIVKNHNGFLRVKTEMGRGTEFEVFLPASLPRAAQAGEAGPGGLPRGQGEHVLLVDDESHVRELAAETLRNHGYQVLTAGDGAEGLAVFLRHQGEIQLVVVDLIMPLMDGVALIQSLRRVAPAVRVVACSGSQADQRLPQPAGAPPVAFLGKPFSVEQLLTTVRHALDTPTAPQ